MCEIELQLDHFVDIWDPNRLLFQISLILLLNWKQVLLSNMQALNKPFCFSEAMNLCIHSVNHHSKIFINWCHLYLFKAAFWVQIFFFFGWLSWDIYCMCYSNVALVWSIYWPTKQESSTKVQWSKISWTLQNPDPLYMWTLDR